MSRVSLAERIAFAAWFLAIVVSLCALAFYCFVWKAHGAPVPPAPKLSAEVLSGTWRYEDDADKGAIAFRTDGTYVRALAGRDLRFGQFVVDGPRVLFTEYRITEWGDVFGPERFELTLSAARWPVLEGLRGSVSVKLSDHNRD